jgi:hypothetical protein
MTKNQRLKVYKSIHNDLKNELIRRQNQLEREPNRLVLKNMVNFCKWYSVGNLPELFIKRPVQCWPHNENFWFEPREITSRLKIIEEVLKEFHVSFLDKLLRRQ